MIKAADRAKQGGRANLPLVTCRRPNQLDQPRQELQLDRLGPVGQITLSQRPPLQTEHLRHRKRRRGEALYRRPNTPRLDTIVAMTPNEPSAL